MGEPAFGAKSAVVVDFEESWGTAKVTPEGRLIGVVSNTLVGAQELIDNPTLRSDFNSVDPFNGRKSAAGDLVLVPNLDAIPFFTKWLTGTLAETGATPDYVLTSKLGSTMPKSAIVETSFNINGTLRYSKASGVRISRLSLPFTVDGPLQMTVGTMGKDVVVGSTAYDASVTDWTAGAALENLLLASADVKIGGSPVGYVRGGTIDIDTALFGDDYRVGGGGARGSLVPGRYRISGNVDLVLDDVAVLAYFAGTPTSLSLKWLSAAGRYFMLTLPRMIIQKTGPKLDNEGPVVIPAQIRGSYSSGDSTSLILETGTAKQATDYA